MNFYFVFSRDNRSNDVESWLREDVVFDITRLGHLVVEEPEMADVIVVVGGDGTMLHAINMYHKYKKPFFGIDRGTLGFLLNPIVRRAELRAVLENMEEYVVVELQLIKGVFTKKSGKKIEALAFNDIFVESRAMLSGTVDAIGEYWLNAKYFRGNGVIVSTPQGSTAYNRSAGGHILPLEEELLAVTSICSQVRPINEVVEMEKVTVRIEKGAAFATADNRRIPNVKKVVITPSGISVRLIFTPESNFQLKRFHIEKEMEGRIRQ